MKEVSQIYWGQHLKSRVVVADWFSFVELNPSRRTVTTLRFEEDFKDIKKAVNKSRSQKTKVDVARRTIMDRWGKRATKMASAKRYNTLTKLRFIVNHVKSYEERIALINWAVLLRIKLLHARNKPWLTEQTLVDGASSHRL